MAHFLIDCLDFDVTFDADFEGFGSTLSSPDNSSFRSQFDFVCVLVLRFSGVTISEILKKFCRTYNTN